MVVRHALADDLGMVQETKMTLVVEGRLSEQAIEELKGLTIAKSHKVLK